MRFEHFFEDGKEGYIEITDINKNSIIKFVVLVVKGGKEIIENTPATIAMDGKDIYIQIIGHHTLIKITKNQKLIDSVWNENNQGMNCAFYKFTTEFKNNWCE